MRRRAIVSDVIADSAAISARDSCLLCQQALHSLRPRRCLAIVPVALTYSAAISACERGQQLQQA